ncbi:MAG: FKBP-type peptidyl-prolyl cis-trans isomerase [Candidatus Saccharimonadales bacterium]|jgi:peptidylprolyl isomerase
MAALADFIPVESVPELVREDRVLGDGEEVQAGATVTCHYTGAIAASGEVFQSSHDFGQAISFPLTGVIAGWAEGVPGMKVAGTRRLLIPAAMAYGANPPYGSGIPANADLVFDIELISID